MRGNVPPKLQHLQRRLQPVALFPLPALLLLGVFVYWPLLRTAFLSTQGVNLFGQPTGYVGFRNYREFFTDPSSRSALFNTLEFAVLTVAMTLVAAMALTLFIGPRQRGGALF